VSDDAARATAAPAAEDDATGHGGRTLTDDRKVPGRVFLVIGAGVGSLGVIYWATAYEEAGTVMLIVATILALWVAVYLWLRERHVEAGDRAALAPAGAADEAEEADAAGSLAGEHAAEQYLPHASVWPFAIGLGAAALGVGLVLGLWVAVPGLGIMALGLGGFIRQTRRRD
jgi:Cytochrome c oxidase subunit IV